MKSCITTKNTEGTAPLNPWGIRQEVIFLHMGSGLSALASAHPDAASFLFCQLLFGLFLSSSSAFLVLLFLSRTVPHRIIACETSLSTCVFVLGDGM